MLTDRRGRGGAEKQSPAAVRLRFRTVPRFGFVRFPNSARVLLTGASHFPSPPTFFSLFSSFLFCDLCRRSSPRATRLASSASRMDDRWPAAADDDFRASVSPPFGSRPRRPPAGTNDDDDASTSSSSSSDDEMQPSTTRRHHPPDTRYVARFLFELRRSSLALELRN